MTDPRATPYLTEVGYRAATFFIDSNAAAGVAITYSSTAANGFTTAGTGACAVTLSANGLEVALAADGEPVIGKLIQVEDDGRCTVQIEGACTLPGGNGATLSLGHPIVGAADGAGNGGFIREPVHAGGNLNEIPALAVAKHMIMNPATATAVVVYLGI